MAYDSLHDRLAGSITKALQKELKIDNVNAVPRLEKVVINAGINKSKMDGKEWQAYVTESITKITGQKPVQTKARKAISNFKIREGLSVGNMVTLRGRQMEEFLDRLVSYVLPRIRDFRGLSPKLDGHGNYAIGIRDHSIFPEVPAPDANQIFGLQVQITTTADNDVYGRALLQHIGMPFKREEVKKGGKGGKGGKEGKEGKDGKEVSEVKKGKEGKDAQDSQDDKDGQENSAEESVEKDTPAGDTETPNS